MDVDIPTGDLIAQLRQELTVNESPKEKTAAIQVTEQNAADFVLGCSATLAQNAMTAMDEIGATVTATGDPEQIGAYAELIKATTSALETINKIVITNKKVKGSIDVKKLELEGKKELQIEEHKHALRASREEVLKMMFADIKEAEVIETLPVDSENRSS